MSNGNSFDVQNCLANCSFVMSDDVTLLVEVLKWYCSRLLPSCPLRLTLSHCNTMHKNFPAILLADLAIRNKNYVIALTLDLFKSLSLSIVFFTFLHSPSDVSSLEFLCICRERKFSGSIPLNIIYKSNVCHCPWPNFWETQYCNGNCAKKKWYW